jgi:hypothetical protein
MYKTQRKGPSPSKVYETYFSSNIYVLIQQTAVRDDVNDVTLVIDGKVGRPPPGRSNR